MAHRKHTVLRCQCALVCRTLALLREYSHPFLATNTSYHQLHNFSDTAAYQIAQNLCNENHDCPLPLSRYRVTKSSHS